MGIIEELQSEVFSIEERFLTGDEKSAMSQIDQITDEPQSSDDQGNAMRSFDLQGTVYQGEPTDMPPESLDVPATDELKHVESFEELSLCLDVLEEGINRANQVLEENREQSDALLTDEMMARFETISDLFVTLMDAVEGLAYEYEDSDIEDQEPEEDLGVEDSDVESSEDVVEEPVDVEGDDSEPDRKSTGDE